MSKYLNLNEIIRFIISYMNLSPIVVFGFNRPNHMNEMLKSLSNNIESKNSKIIFYIDGFDGKNDENIKKTIEVVKKNWVFGEKIINIREKNYGCKFNIIEGISEVLSSSKSAIILEDDLILSKNYLNFINSSLNKYEAEEKVWSISGWAHPQLITTRGGSSFSTLTSPWGWGTWSENWDIFIKNKYYEKNLIPGLSKKERKEFLFYGFANYWEEAIKKDLEGENSVWDAYWYQAIYLNKGFTLFPNTSHVQNKGFDGSGLHCKDNDLFFTPLNKTATKFFPKDINVSKNYKFNTFLFFINYKRKQYFDYHKEKFSSFSNFKFYLRNKLNR
tara:strand:- start:5542 stop:6534 length:993 start_codon:yes stop_codon:yes gene_type:complete